MNTEGSIPLMNESGGYFGAELATHERIRSVQSQIRIAIQNHHLLYTRAQVFPKDADLENHMKILQDVILSLGRTQLELMYQFKIEVKEKHGLANLNNVMAMYLGWPDRHDMHLFKPKENGAPTNGEKRAQIMKKKPLLPQSARPRVKMQSLLKVNHNKSILSVKKENEKLKTTTAKQSESPTSVINSAKKLQSVLKARNEKLNQALVEQGTKSNLTDKCGDADSDLKDSASSGSLKINDNPTSLKDVTQDSFLGFFGLVHKDKSKNMVVTHPKRKRRSATGQSNFHGDFSYFQAKRTYTRKAVAPSSVPESPSSSQDVVDADESDKLSLTSTDKPSEPTSPEIPNSQDMADSQEIGASQELSTDVGAEPAEGNDCPEIVGSTNLNSTDVDETKVADDGKSGHQGEPSTPDLDRILQPPDVTGKDDTLLKDAMETDTPVLTVDKEASPQTDDEKEDECKAGSSNEDQTAFKQQTAGQSITEGCGGGDANMEELGEKILLRYSPGTATVEMLPSGDTECSVDKPPTPANDDLSNDTDPTSFLPNDESQNPDSSHPSRSNVCCVCFESNDVEIEKCSTCGENFHLECVPTPVCPSCHGTPSSISSIVGGNTSSRLTSTDCSEVVKRYLDDSQEGGKDCIDIRDSDNSKDGADINDFTNDKNDASIIDCTDDGDIDELDNPIEDEAISDDTAEDQDGADLNDSAEDTTNDINDETLDQDGDFRPRGIILEDDDSLDFPNSSLFDENSGHSS